MHTQVIKAMDNQHCRKLFSQIFNHQVIITKIIAAVIMVLRRPQLLVKLVPASRKQIAQKVIRRIMKFQALVRAVNRLYLPHLLHHSSLCFIQVVTMITGLSNSLMVASFNGRPLPGQLTFTIQMASQCILLSKRPNFFGLVWTVI